VGPIIRICSLALAGMAFGQPAWGNTPDRLVQAYAEARLADIGQRDAEALKRYLSLSREVPNSEVISDRMFEVAIRSGDMATAARSARAIEARGGGSNLTTLIVFADAWRAKDWRAAGEAANRLASGGNLAFMAPILKSWMQVGQGRPPSLPDADADSFFAYYSADQRIYLDLASGRMVEAKAGLRGLAGQSGDHVRDVLITGAYNLQKTDANFARALMRSVIGTAEPLNIITGRRGFSASSGLAPLYARIASALTEQDMAEEALILARAAQWIAPDLMPARLTLADALAANGLRQQALEMLSAATTDAAYRIPLLEKRVDLLIAANKSEEARAAVIEAARQTPRSVAVKLLAARVHEALGDRASVIAAFREMTDAPDFAELAPRQQGAYRLMLASALDSAGDWPNARAELERLLLADPNNAQALNYLGYSLLERSE
jgi:tetratricopeptide (TPR) repeat protein